MGPACVCIFPVVHIFSSQVQTTTLLISYPYFEQERLKRAQDAEREKRAAAAERRIAAAAALRPQGTGSLASSSQMKVTETSDTVCSCCHVSLAGIVPFHRYNYKYCSASCMHVHKEILDDG